jgi:ParB/RepB/Spo0J family partition protein
MNAPITRDLAARMAEAAYELIPLANIAVSDTHIQKLRRARYNMESLADLRSSISKLGVQQPVVVRKLQALRGLAAYELVAGERRYRAAGQAGLAHLPAVIRQLTDEEVLEVQLVENLQREDLHPLEEAAGYEELMKVAKLKPEELGDKVGKSRSWVYSRLNLLKLPKNAQDALQDGRLDVSRALLVASVADAEQRDLVLEMALERTHGNNPSYSVRQLRAKTLKERLTFPLIGAPFPTDDAALVPKAGACGGCQYRTGNCDPEAADPDVCTNVPCYHLKVKTHGDNRRKAVLAAGGKVLRGEDARKISPSIKTCYGHVDLDLVCEHDNFPEPEPEDVDYDNSSDPRMVAWHTKEEAWQPRTYRALLAGQKYESVLIDDPKTKQLRELVPFKQAQQLLKKLNIDLPSYANKQRQSFQRRDASSPAAAKKDPAKEAAEQAKRDLEERIEKVTLIRILEQAKAKHPGVLSVDDLSWLANHALDDVPEEFWKAFGLKDPGWQTESTIKKVPGKDLARFISVALLAHGLTGNYRDTEATAAASLGRLKIDRKKIEADVRKELTPKQTKTAWPFPTGAKAPAAKSSKKGKK